MLDFTTIESEFKEKEDATIILFITKKKYLL